MSTGHTTTLVDMVGFLTGAVLYGMLLALVFRRPGVDANVAPAQSRGGATDSLALATGLLGLAWNAGGFARQLGRGFGFDEPSPLLDAAAFAALGFLPAVVVHSALLVADGSRSQPSWLLAGAYGASSAAAAAHVATAIWAGASPSYEALYFLTAAFVVVVAALFLVTSGQPGRRRAVWAVALALFAVSALHLGQHSANGEAWWVELAGHHASLPLALAILYQDFKFAFADLFLKRALALLAIVATVVVAYSVAIAPMLEARDAVVGPAPELVLAVLALAIGAAVAFPSLERACARFVDSIVLRRADYTRIGGDIARSIAGIEAPGEMLDEACRRLGPALSAREVRWAVADDGFERQVETNRGSGAVSSNAVVTVPTVDLPCYVIRICDLEGGRRLLSDDVAMLDAVATTLGRRIDAVRVAHERCEHELRQQEVSKLATEAELRALRAQINPHFLFNALTTIGYLIQTAPDRALDTLYHLTDLLRGVLSSSGEFSTLGEEIDLVESYLDIERARFEERLRVRIDVAENARSLRVPALVLQPLVENAIKHGISPRSAGGEVVVAATVEAGVGVAGGSVLRLTVKDSGVGASEVAFAHGRRRGVGLANVERRLECHYGAKAQLCVESVPGEGTTVTVRLPAHTTHVGAHLERAGTESRRSA